MTIREQCEMHLVQSGLWPDEAEAVVRAAVYDATLEPMQLRWDDNVAAYPQQLLPVLALILKRLAVSWLMEHKPQHFALALLGEPVAAPVGE